MALRRAPRRSSFRHETRRIHHPLHQRHRDTEKQAKGFAEARNSRYDVATSTKHRAKIRGFQLRCRYASSLRSSRAAFPRASVRTVDYSHGHDVTEAAV